MEKVKMDVKRYEALGEKLTGFLEMECCASVKEIETKECGEVTDMIKDLAEAKKSCWEALYYEMMCKQMKKMEEQNGEQQNSMGYNSNRYSSGRYAPSGHGDSTMGYHPTVMDLFVPPHMMEYPTELMGYSGGNGSSSSSNSGGGNSSGGRGGNSGSSGSSGESNSSSSGNSGGGRSGFQESGMGMNEYDPRYGESFNRYREAKRHYTESHSTEDKKEMDSHAEQHLRDAMDTTKEVYKSASPELKKKYKEELLTLINSLPVS